MKREAFLMLVAGTLLGAVLGFIGTRQYYVDKATVAPAPLSAMNPEPAAAATGDQTGSAQQFDSTQHLAMLAQVQAEIDKDPKNIEKRVMLGNILYDAGKWDQAIPLYEQALQLDATNTDVIVDLGVCYRNVKKVDEALAMFDRALRIDPDKKQALFNKVIVYGIDKGDKAKALAALKLFEAKYPNEPAAKQLAAELDKKS
jgi:cytochrome c-type biogenesis protein CcmH/NrfG